MEPAVGASAYVMGDQVWNGQIGDFTAKAIVKAINSQTDVPCVNAVELKAL